MGLLEILFLSANKKSTKKFIEEQEKKKKEQIANGTYVENNADFFKGRLSRTNYTIAFLTLLFGNLVIALLFSFDLLPLWSYAVLIIWWFVAIIMTISINIRRLHDINKSGWMILLFIIPLINLWLLINLLASKSIDNDNKFGEKTEDGYSLKSIFGL
jgi:uncharacterized membrane protein YhaH (DUF805 family)